MADPNSYLLQTPGHPSHLGVSSPGSGLGLRGLGGSGGQTPGGGASKPTYSKRGKITIVACVPCRRRKTKCDGRRPTCSQCASRDSACSYDMNEEQRRLTFLRENVDELKEEKAALEAVIWHLRTSQEGEALEILRRLRSGQHHNEYSGLVRQIQASRSLTEVGSAGLNVGSFGASPMQHQARSFEHIVQAIAAGSPVDSDDIVRRLRRREPIERVLEATTVAETAMSETMELDSPGRAGFEESQTSVRPMVGNALAPRMPGTSHTAESGRAPDAHTPPRSRSRTHRDGFMWTIVTEDREFIDHLLDVYFTWQHTFFQNFPEALFRKDYKNGRTKFCSRVLVNAICAAGCLLSDRDEARGDPRNPSTAGAGFFEEGMGLLNQSDRSSIPTTAGVFILSHVEGYRARLGAMWGLVGRSARMAIDLGLHLRNDKISADIHGSEPQKEEAGRIHAFWGCFVSDQITSLTLGRLPQLLTNSITVELPPVGGPEDEEPWGPQSSKLTKRPGARATTFRHCASLSKIVNSTLLMFFAPNQIIKGSLLLDEYEKYLGWYKNLPKIIKSPENAPAHVISLHMYYHVSVLLLFRPFLRAKFTASPISPSELCRSAATSISELFARHLKLYGNVGIYTLQIQCLLAACTIHLINLPAIAAASALTRAADHLNGLIYSSTWALRAIRLLRDLVRRWNIILPREAEVALYSAKREDFPPEVWGVYDDPAAPKADFMAGHSTAGLTEESGSEAAGEDTGSGAAAERSSASQGGVPSKRSAFLNPSSQTPILQKRQRLAPVQQQRARASQMEPDSDDENEDVADSEEDGEGETTGGEGDTASSSKENVTGGNKQGHVLFAPFPNQPVPLLGPIHTSNQPDSNWSDEVRNVTRDFDGLKFEGDGWFDPFMGI